MKKTFVFLALAAILATACTKNNHGSDDGIVSAAKHGVEDNPNGGGGNNTTSVPAAVLATFNHRYPDATHIEWKKLSDGNYKAEFFRGAVKWQSTFTPAGILVREEHN